MTDFTLTVLTNEDDPTIPLGLERRLFRCAKGHVSVVTVAHEEPPLKLSSCGPCRMEAAGQGPQLRTLNCGKCGRVGIMEESDGLCVYCWCGQLRRELTDTVKAREADLAQLRKVREEAIEAQRERDRYAQKWNALREAALAESAVVDQQNYATVSSRWLATLLTVAEHRSFLPRATPSDDADLLDYKKDEPRKGAK